MYSIDHNAQIVHIFSVFCGILFPKTCPESIFLSPELLGDERTLLDVVHRLGEAYQYLAKMAEFWDDMAVVVMHLMKESTLGN